LAREQRRLAAILAADVVGYSRLMGRDERGTLQNCAAAGPIDSRKKSTAVRFSFLVPTPVGRVKNGSETIRVRACESETQTWFGTEGIVLGLGAHGPRRAPGRRRLFLRTRNPTGRATARAQTICLGLLRVRISKPFARDSGDVIERTDVRCGSDSEVTA
jgi:hypothetical protein